MVSPPSSRTPVIFLPLNKHFSTGLNVGAVYNNNYIALNSKGISHIDGTISLSYIPKDNLSINTSYTLQKRVDNSFDEMVKNEGYWKVSLTHSF